MEKLPNELLDRIARYLYTPVSPLVDFHPGTLFQLSRVSRQWHPIASAILQRAAVDLRDIIRRLPRPFDFSAANGPPGGPRTSRRLDSHMILAYFLQFVALLPKGCRSWVMEGSHRAHAPLCLARFQFHQSPTFPLRLKPLLVAYIHVARLRAQFEGPQQAGTLLRGSGLSDLFNPDFLRAFAEAEKLPGIVNLIEGDVYRGFDLVEGLDGWEPVAHLCLLKAIFPQLRMQCETGRACDYHQGNLPAQSWRCLTVDWVEVDSAEFEEGKMVNDDFSNGEG